MTSLPPTIRFIGLYGSSKGTSDSFNFHRGSFFRDRFTKEKVVAINCSVVLAGVEGGDVVEVMLVAEVVLCSRIAFPLSNRDLFNVLVSVCAVRPHGNSTVDERKWIYNVK